MSRLRGVSHFDDVSANPFADVEQRVAVGGGRNGGGHVELCSRSSSRASQTCTPNVMLDADRDCRY